MDNFGVLANRYDSLLSSWTLLIASSVPIPKCGLELIRASVRHFLRSGNTTCVCPWPPDRGRIVCKRQSTVWANSRKDQ